MNQPTIILWAKEGCHYCQTLKEYFAREQLTYRLIDVTHQDAFRSILQTKYGVSYVPVVEVAKENSLQFTGVTSLEVADVIAAIDAHREVVA